MKKKQTAEPDLRDLPNIAADHFRAVDSAQYRAAGDPGHPPRILLLYGSLRKDSYSRMAAEEAGRFAGRGNR